MLNTKIELSYALVETLNGNWVLKTVEKAEKNYDSIEMEFYGNTMEDIRAQKNEHLKMLRADGLI